MRTKNETTSKAKEQPSFFVQQSERLINKPIRIWVLSLIITALLFALVYSFIPYIFSTNDDTYISTALGGYRTEDPVLFCQFVNPLFSYIVGGLYTLIPGINWYTVFHFSALFISITIIGRCFLCLALKKKMPLLFSVCTLVFIDFSLYTYVMTLLSFTTTPAVLGAAAIALFLCSDIKNKRWLRDFIVCALLLFACYIWRKSTGMASLCFFAGAVLYKVCIMLAKKEKLKKYLKLGTSVLMVVIMIAAAYITAYFVYNVQFAKFTAFDTARSKYMDYPHARYSENQAGYDAYGINGELYNVMQSWFFMDDSINVHSFSALSGTDGLMSFDFANSFYDAANLFGNRMFYNLLLLISNAIALIFIAHAIITFIRNKKSLDSIIHIVFTLGGALVFFAMCLYLCLTGRFPQRAMYAIYMPAVVFVVSLSLSGDVQEHSFLRSLFSHAETKKPFFHELKSIAWSTLFLAALILIVCGMYEHSRILPYRQYCAQRGKQIEQYAIEHEGNLYITDSDTCNDFVDANALYVDGKKPTNLIFWGGCKMYSPVFFEQLEENGYDEFYADIYLKKNVYYVGLSRYSNAAANFLRYMFTKYNVRTLEFESTITSDVRAYDVGEQYFPQYHTGFNTFRGQRFYYENGTLKTGWFTVNGKTYYAHPAGVYSTIVYDPNTRSYSTTAGALVHGISQIGDAAYMFNSFYEYVPGVVYYLK